MINHPDIFAEIQRQRLAEMIAAANEFRCAKQLRKPRWKLRKPGISTRGVATPLLARDI